MRKREDYERRPRDEGKKNVDEFANFKGTDDRKEMRMSRETSTNEERIMRKETRNDKRGHGREDERNRIGREGARERRIMVRK